MVTLGGSQHTSLKRMLQAGGVNSDTDVTTVLAGDVPAQLQALVVNSIQAAALSPPIVIVTRDKFKMNMPKQPSDVFDFTLQKEFNRELGIR